MTYFNDLKDIYVDANKRSLKRSYTITELGTFCLSRRDVELYSVLIFNSGAWTRMEIYDGDYRPLYIMPSMFTGSFYLQGGCNGLIVNVTGASPPQVGIVWSEEDQEIV